jgi:hypothetical protein
MFNREKLKNARGSSPSFKSIKGGGSDGPKFSRLLSKEFPDGEYPIRFFWPHATNCPDGFTINSTYSVEVTAGEKGVSTLSPIALDAKQEPCYMHERILHQIDDRNLMEDFSEGMAKAVKKLVPWDRYQFPIAVVCDAKSRGFVSVNGRDYENFDHSPGKGGPHPRVWEINFDAAVLCRKIEEIFAKYPDISDPVTGRWVIMQKTHNTFNFIVDDEPSPVSKAVLDMHGNLYDMVKSKNKNYREPEAITSVIMKSWMFTRLKKYDIDLRTDFEIIEERIDATKRMRAQGMGEEEIKKELDKDPKTALRPYVAVEGEEEALVEGSYDDDDDLAADLPVPRKSGNAGDSPLGELVESFGSVKSGLFD